MTAVQRVRVPASLAYAILYLYAVTPTVVWILPGLTLVLMGLVLRLWASGYLQKFQGLTVSGPYRWTRNPLYLGSFLFGLGFSIAGSQLWILVLYILVFPALYLPVIRAEERELEGLGDSYKAYRAAVPAFLPRPWYRRALPVDLGSAECGRFRWCQLMENREYRAVVVALVLVAAVVIKMQNA